MTDIVTRIRNFGLGQKNLARQIMQAAEEEAAYWEQGDDPTLSAALREEQAARRRQIRADAAARAKPMLERAAEAEKDPPLLLRRPDVEARDPSLRPDANPDFDRLYHDALRANLATFEIT
jgi:hypothetical protein